MVRNYQRTTERGKWETSSMQEAIKAVRCGKMSLRRASQAFGVPRTTLQRRAVWNGSFHEAACKVSLGIYKPVFSSHMEHELKEYIDVMESMLFGLTIGDLRTIAYQFAEINHVAHNFDRETKQAGRDFVYGFMKRQKLTLRTPEKTSSFRARGFNKVNVDKFYNLLEEQLQIHKFPATKIYNVDEHGITTVPNKPSKIIASRGKRQVGALTSAEKGQLVTVELCMSASGHFVPPLFIFPRMRLKPEFMDRAPAGSVAVAHPSGWMQAEIFTEWFKHFLTYTHPTQEQPVLLILDGHKTHTMNIEVIKLARENHVVLLCLPPHTSHKLQPLDVAFMKPLSTFYTKEVENWLRYHPGRSVTLSQVGELFGVAYNKATSAQTALHGFKKTGIWPFNRDVFGDQDFSAALPTERPEPKDVSVDVEDSDVDEGSSSEVAVDAGDSVLGLADITNIVCTNNTHTAHGYVGSTSTNASAVRTPEAKEVTTSSVPAAREHISQSKGGHTPVTEIFPYPKCDTRTTKASSQRRSGQTVVLTTSDYIRSLEKQKCQTNHAKVKKTEKGPIKGRVGVQKFYGYRSNKSEKKANRKIRF